MNHPPQLKNAGLRIFFFVMELFFAVTSVDDSVASVLSVTVSVVNSSKSISVTDSINNYSNKIRNEW